MRAFTGLVEGDELREVAMIGHARVVVLEEFGAEGVDFAEERRGPAQGFPRDGGGFNAAADGSVDHGVLVKGLIEVGIRNRGGA